MIIGKPLTAVGKGESASIFAYGDDLTSSCTCSATKGSKTRSGVWTTRTVSSVSTNGFLISNIDEYGTWTLTASDGTHTKTYSVLVDAAEEYDVEIELSA